MCLFLGGMLIAITRSCCRSVPWKLHEFNEILWDPQTERDARAEEKHQGLRSRQTYRPCSRTPAGCRQLRLDRCYHRLAISMLPSDRTFQTHYCSMVNIQQTRSYSTLIYSWESQKEVMCTLQGNQLPLTKRS